MSTTFNIAIKDNLSHRLRATFFYLVFNEYMNLTQDKIYFDHNRRLRDYNNFFIESKNKIYDYINEFDNRKLFLYLRKQIDYSFAANPINKYNELKRLYEEKNSEPDSNVILEMSKIEEDIFKTNYELYILKCEEFEALIFEFYKNFENYRINDNKEEITNIILDHNPVFVIDDNIDLNIIRKNARELTDYDQHVISLLFSYLKDNNAILNFSNSSLSRIISILTMTSKNNLRTESLNYIDNVRNGKSFPFGNYKNNPTLLHKTLKTLLEKIISQIDNDIDKYN